MPVPTLPQTICLLAFSRGEQPPMMAAVTRRAMLRYRWIATMAEKRRHEITRAGSDALATSRHRSQAERQLDAGKQGKPWP